MFIQSNLSFQSSRFLLMERQFRAKVISWHSTWHSFRALRCLSKWLAQTGSPTQFLLHLLGSALFVLHFKIAVSPWETQRQLLTVNMEQPTNATHSSCAGLKTNKPAKLKLARQTGAAFKDTHGSEDHSRRVASNNNLSKTNNAVDQQKPLSAAKVYKLNTSVV